MPISTKEEMASVLSFGGLEDGPLPFASGSSITQPEMRHLLELYAGLTIMPPVIPPLPLYAAILNDDVGYGAILRS